jgi:hypothetical protein
VVREVRLVPCGWPCSLAECPPGPFASLEGHLGFKSEYGTTAIAPECTDLSRAHALRWVVTGAPDVYCLESGERWCPDVLVQPLRVEVTP